MWCGITRVPTANATWRVRICQAPSRHPCGTEGRRATLLANECRPRLRLAPALSMIAIPPSPRTATPRSPLPLATIALSFLAWPARAPAQLYAGLDAAFASRYVWRGVTRVDGAVLQPEGYLGLQLDDGYLSASAWGSYELSRAGPSGLSDLGPGRTGFGEIDYWSQYARALGSVQTSLGFIHYTYRGTPPAPSRSPTSRPAA